MFTALIQSSSASTGVVITMVGAGVLPLELALFIVLGANIGGIPELIAEGKTGELFESGNETQLKTKIEQFCFEFFKFSCQLFC